MQKLVAIAIMAVYLLCIKPVVNNVDSSENHKYFIGNAGLYKPPVPEIAPIRVVPKIRHKVTHNYGDTFTVSATVYNAVAGQSDDTPTITADGTDINKFKQHILSISQDMLKRNGGIYNFGDSVKISGTDKFDGIYYIHDLMHERYTRSIDVLVPNNIKVGKWNKVVISKIESVVISAK